MAFVVSEVSKSAAKMQSHTHRLIKTSSQVVIKLNKKPLPIATRITRLEHNPSNRVNIIWDLFWDLNL